MMLEIIKHEYNNLTDLEKKTLRFGIKIIFTETSKFLILLLFFFILGRHKEFLFAVITLVPLRCNMGGIHFRTYLGCLVATFFIFTTSILVFPDHLDTDVQLATLLLVICLMVNIIIGPVINPTRPPLTKMDVKQIRMKVSITLFLYILLVNLFEINSYILCGMWIIVEQTLQLIIAKIQRNGDY